jgi:hypothetical protein
VKVVASAASVAMVVGVVVAAVVNLGGWMEAAWTVAEKAVVAMLVAGVVEMKVVQMEEAVNMVAWVVVWVAVTLEVEMVVMVGLAAQVEVTVADATVDATAEATAEAMATFLRNNKRGN